MSMAQPNAKRPWFGSEVGLDRRCGTKVYCKSRGLTPAQFEQVSKFGGKTFKELGYVQKLPPGHKGHWFFCICMVDDSSLQSDIGTQYESFYTVGPSQLNLMMVPSKQVRHNQPMELFDFLWKPQRSGARLHQITNSIRLNAVEPNEIPVQLKLVLQGNVILVEQQYLVEKEHQVWVSCLEFCICFFE